MGSLRGCVCRSCFASSVGASTQFSTSCLCGDHLPHMLWATHHPVSQLGASVADERWLISDSLVTHTDTGEGRELLRQLSKARAPPSCPDLLALLRSRDLVYSNITLPSVSHFLSTDTSLPSLFWPVLSLQIFISSSSPSFRPSRNFTAHD